MSVAKSLLLVILFVSPGFAQTQPAAQDLSAFKRLLSEREAAYQVPLYFEFTDTRSLADGVPHVSSGIAFVNGGVFAASGTNEPPTATTLPTKDFLRLEYIVYSHGNSGGVWTKPNGIGLEYFDLTPPLPADVTSAKASIERLAPPSPYRFSLGDGTRSILELMKLYETSAGILQAVTFPRPGEAVFTLSYAASANGIGSFFTAYLDVTGEPVVKRIEGRDRKGVVVRTIEILQRTSAGPAGREVDCVAEWLETTYESRAPDDQTAVIKRTRRVQMRGFRLEEDGQDAASFSLFDSTHGVPEGAHVVQFLKDGTKQILMRAANGKIETVSIEATFK